MWTLILWSLKTAKVQICVFCFYKSCSRFPSDQVWWNKSRSFRYRHVLQRKDLYVNTSWWKLGVGVPCVKVERWLCLSSIMKFDVDYASLWSFMFSICLNFPVSPQDVVLSWNLFVFLKRMNLIRNIFQLLLVFPKKMFA